MFPDLTSVDQAYPELVSAVLPPAFLGFFAAVIFGAILSSFNSVLNSSVTLFGVDIYKQHINPQADEATVVRKGKMFGIALAVGAMIIAPFIANAGSLFDYLQEINGIYSIPILTIIVVGYLTKRVPAIAAKIGLLSGSLLYIVSQFFLKPHFVSQAVSQAKIDGITDPSALAVVESQGYFGLHYLDVMAILFVLNVLIMLLIGKFYPREAAYTQAYTKQVDIKPWPYTKPVGGLIVLIVAAIYIYFA